MTGCAVPQWVAIMERVKSCYQKCFENCWNKRKYSSDSTMRIVLPSMSQRNSVATGNTCIILSQPEFHIPGNENMLLNPSSPVNRRKVSVPCTMTSAELVQPRSMSCPNAPQLGLSFDSAMDEVFRCKVSSPSVSPPGSAHGVSSKTSPASTHRLSVHGAPATHSRRSSMSSFDICKEEVDSCLYGSEEDIGDINSCGRLCFSARYEDERLHVTIICARQLREGEDHNPRDSRVEIRLSSPKKKVSKNNMTKIQKMTVNPNFNETFTFDMAELGSMDTVTLELVVFIFENNNKRRKLGKVLYALDEDLKGETGQKIWRNIYGKDEAVPCGSMGNLLLSTTYQPTDGLLLINVVKASELKLNDTKFKSIEGLYVKAALVANGKVLDKQKTKAIQPVEQNVTFDETFCFTVPGSSIDAACVMVSVCGKTSFSKGRLIGYISLGPPFFANGSGLEQWTKMVSMPFTSVGKWHSLSSWNEKDNLSHHLDNDCRMF